jgi:hypothetical protein
MTLCACGLAEFYDLSKEEVRKPCEEYRPEDPASPYCSWCEHARECHKETES